MTKKLKLTCILLASLIVYPVMGSDGLDELTSGLGSLSISSAEKETIALDKPQSIISKIQDEKLIDYFLDFLDPSSIAEFGSTDSLNNKHVNNYRKRFKLHEILYSDYLKYKKYNDSFRNYLKVVTSRLNAPHFPLEKERSIRFFQRIASPQEKLHLLGTIYNVYKNMGNFGDWDFLVAGFTHQFLICEQVKPFFTPMIEINTQKLIRQSLEIDKKKLAYREIKAICQDVFKGILNMTFSAGDIPPFIPLNAEINFPWKITSTQDVVFILDFDQKNIILRTQGNVTIRSTEQLPHLWSPEIHAPGVELLFDGI